MTKDFGLEGRVALVTGGVRGLGFEIARSYAAAGACVYINGRDPSGLEAAQTNLRSQGVTVDILPFDVADEKAQARCIDRIMDDKGRLDILVNNAATRMREPLERIDGAKLQGFLDVNLVAAFSLSRLAAPLMASGQFGRIINIGSIAGERGRQGDAAYIIAKGALNAMTRVLAAEFGPQGVTCNAILPGSFRTEVNEALFSSGAMDDWFRSRTLLGRPADPSEISGAALFLASPLAGYVTGVLLPVDGGYLAAA